MEKRMTSGEIAKKTGVSQKTVRLYDEKGRICVKYIDYYIPHAPIRQLQGLNLTFFLSCGMVK